MNHHPRRRLGFSATTCHIPITLTWTWSGVYPYPRNTAYLLITISSFSLQPSSSPLHPIQSTTAPYPRHRAWPSSSLLLSHPFRCVLFLFLFLLTFPSPWVPTCFLTFNWAPDVSFLPPMCSESLGWTPLTARQMTFGYPMPVYLLSLRFLSPFLVCPLIRPKVCAPEYLCS
ncbi:hypothetical protein DFP72DRAFT_415393 [Ephemerocybe angulata]|uniref:Uncharacterized protein n=1 Tax=Ephemerocybe angulata TaxID=980116 RepID=A0A8H6IGS7_9AGAR|nr:hypothetical protein DFP72DRAFT_415393 [Tulosesus angulatus]